MLQREGGALIFLVSWNLVKQILKPHALRLPPIEDHLHYVRRQDSVNRNTRLR